MDYAQLAERYIGWADKAQDQGSMESASANALTAIAYGLLHLAETVARMEK